MRIPYITYVQGRNSYAVTTKYGIAIHNTSNNATARNEASYATRRTDGVSAHFYADDVTVIQSIDTANKTGHAGSSTGNNNAVSVEITGVNSWSRQQWASNVNWDLLGKVLADVCRAYGISARRASVTEMRSNPKVKAFYSHDDMRRAWGGTDHTDPGANFPWDLLFASVNKYLNPNSTPGSAPGVKKEEKELFFAKDQFEQHYLCDGMESRPISVADIPHIQTLANEGKIQVVDPYQTRVGWFEGAFGVVREETASVPAEVDATEVANALKSDQEFLAAIAKAVADEFYRRQAN